MAYTGTICTEAEINAFAGENVDATGNTEANHNYWVAHAEAYISALVAYNVVSNWASLTAIGKAIITELGARIAANNAIAYNMSGFTSRTEALEMMNWNFYRIEKCEEILRTESIQNFLGA
jgi:hypothetical protein